MEECMKLLFVHGAEKLKEDEVGDFYTSGSYNQEVWDRYLSIFENLTVIFRKDANIYEPLDAISKFQFFDKDKINFIEIADLNYSYSTFFSYKKRMDNNHILEKAVKDNDYLIARLPSSAGNLAVKYAVKHNKPYMVELVGCPWDAYWNHSVKGKVAAPYMWGITKRIVKKAPNVFYVTNEFLQRRYPSKGKTIGCSDVALPSFDESLLEKRILKIQQIDINKPIILGTTAVVNMRYKGQLYVIEAISRLISEGYNFEYYLTGAGDNTFLKSVAEKYGVSNKVKFLGSLPHEKVFEYLDTIDIYVQPSDTEGLPRALVEAMSRGCPSIGSNVGGIPELLNRKLLFRKGSVTEICNLLKTIREKTILLNEAKRSFKKAKEYNKELLDIKRLDFYNTFAEGVKKRND
jgi:glycosyltransferase involved in cell wall biosynthesis